MNFKTFLPRVQKNYLLLLAAFVWTFAGIMLLTRGYLFSETYPNHYAIKMTGSFLGGILFFMLLFQKISKNHVDRIFNLKSERPTIFSFFNLKSYLMMFGMISGGILLRKSGVISPEYLAIIYVTMGTPLLLSSIRFYYSFFSIQNRI